MACVELHLLDGTVERTLAKEVLDKPLVAVCLKGPGSGRNPCGEQGLDLREESTGDHLLDALVDPLVEGFTGRAQYEIVETGSLGSGTDRGAALPF